MVVILTSHCCFWLALLNFANHLSYNVQFHPEYIKEINIWLRKARNPMCPALWTKQTRCQHSNGSTKPRTVKTLTVPLMIASGNLSLRGWLRPGQYRQKTALLKLRVTEEVHSTVVKHSILLEMPLRSYDLFDLVRTCWVWECVRMTHFNWATNLQMMSLKLWY